MVSVKRLGPWLAGQVDHRMEQGAGYNVAPITALPFPAFNLVVENDMVGLSGPSTRASHRDLVGSGWAVAALLRPAAVPALTNDPTSLRDSYVPLSAPQLQSAVTEAVATRHFDDAVAKLSAWVTSRIGPLSDEARLANSLAEVAGTKSSVVSVGDLASALKVSMRTVHRLAEQYIGLTPHALIRRRRLQEAAERIRADPSVSLSTVAVAHGFSDQAHFAREFQRLLGRGRRNTRGGFGRLTKMLAVANALITTVTAGAFRDTHGLACILADTRLNGAPPGGTAGPSKCR